MDQMIPPLLVHVLETMATMSEITLIKTDIENLHLTYAIVDP